MAKIWTSRDAAALMKELECPPRLTRHIALVSEAALLLMHGLRENGLCSFDADLVGIGVIFHDAGKILHPEELDGGGNLHEEAGQALLLSHSVPLGCARFCLSHARWRELPNVTIDEFIVALADKLWKGARDPDLERAVICGAVTPDLPTWYWDKFIACDTLFESIAADGHDRLERSRG